MEEIQKYLKQVCYLLNQQTELRNELAALSEKLPPLLESQAKEFANLTTKISEAQQQLAELEGKIAAAQLRHSQLEASEVSLKARMGELGKRVDQALEGFRLHRAQA
jgi:chromosome segregation ATPase